MSTLKLPKPLDYDYVDELIDSSVYFFCHWFSVYDVPIFNDSRPNNMYVLRARPLQGEDGEYLASVGGYGRELFEICEDTHLGDYKEDKDGYIHYDGGIGMVWVADWTEEDTDNYLNEFFEDD